MPNLFYIGDNCNSDKSKIAGYMVYQKKIICIFKNIYQANKITVNSLSSDPVAGFPGTENRNQVIDCPVSHGVPGVRGGATDMG